MKTFFRAMIVLNLLSAVANGFAGNVAIATMNNVIALVMIWLD